MKTFSFVLYISFFISAGQAQTLPANHSSSAWHIKAAPLVTRWAKNVHPNHVHDQYPRPQLRRDRWQNLNGLWDYALTPLDSSSALFPDTVQGKILVPFPIESALSGVKQPLLPTQSLWYRRQFIPSSLDKRERLLLHFGAVDWQATVFVNGHRVGHHQGGYTAFSFDITDYIRSGRNELVVRVYDPTDRGIGPHGKQVLHPGNIYYTASSGIWQTVWLEAVPENHITSVKTTPDIDNGLLHVTVDASASSHVEVTVKANDKIINKVKGVTAQDITIPIKNARLWSPEDPFLYDLDVELTDHRKTIDQVTSYSGMRKIAIQKDENGFDRIFLNNRYTYNLGVLDQGFWPDGLYTAPTDEALAFDIRAIKAMGFNTIRKHIKVEPARWYYHADKIGVLVWQDFVNPNQVLPAGAKAEFERETKEILDQLHNHPSITTWVLFNERWGAYDQQRLTEWVRQYDPSRLVNGHSGELLYVNEKLRAPAKNPYVSSDMVDYHSYPNPMDVKPIKGKASVLGEFGGVGVSVAGHQWNDLQGWGYVQVTAEQLQGEYAIMMKRLLKLEKTGLSASIYTQPFDVEGEENGLLTYDRAILKIPVKEIRRLNSQLVKQTRGFVPDPNFYVAKDVDVRDNDSRYPDFLQAYDAGKKDSAFLRRLCLMALRQKDQPRASQVSGSYISSLTQPFDKENLNFIKKITRTSQDKGFALFLKDSAQVNAILGDYTAQKKLMDIIAAEEIAPHLQQGVAPDWSTIDSTVFHRFGALGRELVYSEALIYYWSTAPNADSLAKYYVLYLTKALTHSRIHLNNASWAIFKQVNDPEVLRFAAKVSKYDVDTFYPNDPINIDTYANLLYKAGEVATAIQWEEKAVGLSNNGKEYVETLSKMKRGEKTWP